MINGGFYYCVKSLVCDSVFHYIACAKPVKVHYK